jgi:Flp pilus assembly pilin Flp
MRTRTWLADSIQALLGLFIFRHTAEGRKRGGVRMALLVELFRADEGQDITEYAVMLAVILVIVVGTIRLIGSNANTVFSRVASSVQ